MDDNIVICILLIFLLLVSMDKTKYSREGFNPFSPGLVKECNKIDDRCYKVSNKFDSDTYNQASQILARLNIFSITLIRHLRKTYLWNNNNKYKHDMVEFLLQNYNPGSIIENAPDSDVNTSYVENKGKVFAICLREKSSGKNKFLPMHLIEFVVLHEMSHLASRGIGHGSEFWINFKIMLKEANKIHLHKPIDYSKHPVVYCSLKVQYNPFFDDNIPDL